jgi:hypothetical protein
MCAATQSKHDGERGVDAEGTTADKEDFIEEYCIAKRRFTGRWSASFSEIDEYKYNSPELYNPPPGHRPKLPVHLSAKS